MSGFSHPYEISLLLVSLLALTLNLPSTLTQFNALLFLSPHPFLLVIMRKVVKQSSQGVEGSENLEHSLSYLWVDLLAVATLNHWFIFVEWICQVAKLSVRDVLDEFPLNFD